jgi:ribosomal protein L7/L12
MKHYLAVLNTLESAKREIGDYAVEKRITRAQRSIMRYALQGEYRRKKVDKFFLTLEEEDFAKRRDGKIGAIKRVRERTGMGLKESKDHVEGWMQEKLGFTHWPPDPNGPFYRPGV